MSKARHLQLMSFTIDDKILERMFSMHDIYYVNFPQEWMEPINQTDDYKVKSRLISQLNQTLQLTFPQIFFANSRLGNDWLLSFEPIDTSFIKVACGLSLKKFSDKLAEPTDFAWNRIGSVDEIGESARYGWIPALFAKKLAESGQKKMKINPNEKGSYTYPILDETLQFHPVRFHNKYECISDVIKRKDREGQSIGNYSYVIKFSYNNRALTPEPGILNVKFGIRRYLETGIKSADDIHYWKNGSMLVQLDSPFLANEASFFHWQFRRTGGSKRGNIGWDYTTKSFINHVSSLTKVDLNPKHILENPLQYRQADSLVLPVFSHQIFNNKSLTGTEAGLGLREKTTLFQFVKETFPFLTRLPKGRDVAKVTAKRALTPFIEPANEIERIRLEIWGPKSLKEQFMKYNVDFFEANNGGESTYTLQTERKNPLKIEIVRMDPEEIIRAKAKREKDEHYIAGTVDRLNEIEVPEGVVTISLVEILSQRGYGGYEFDPKQVLRESFAKTGRLTQFIHPLELSSEKERKARLMNSFKDLLADLGFIPQRIKSVIDDDTIIFSIGKISRGNKFTPVISYFSQDTPLRMKVYDKEWQLFHESLLQMLEFREHYFNIYDKKKAIFEKFIFDTLLEVVTNTDKKIIVIFDEFYRRYCSFVQNQNLNKMIPMLKEKGFKSDMERLRFVRISNLDEIPQYKLWDKKSYINYESGLFSTNENIYYSIALRMDNMSKVKGDSIKYGNLHVFYVHQSIVEFVTLGCSSVEASDELARIVHLLRRVPITTEKGTTRPYPLHLYQSLGKYIPKYLYEGESDGKTVAFGNDDREFVATVEEIEESKVKQLKFEFGLGEDGSSS